MTSYHVINNRAQGDFKRVLCVCTGGVLRSPTAALVLSQEPYHFNTRCAGALDSCALIPVTGPLVRWADEFVFMTADHYQMVHEKFDLSGETVKILDIPDEFNYRDPVLITMIRARYDEAVARALKA